MKFKIGNIIKYTSNFSNGYYYAIINKIGNYSLDKDFKYTLYVDIFHDKLYKGKHGNTDEVYVKYLDSDKVEYCNIYEDLDDVMVDMI